MSQRQAFIAGTASLNDGDGNEIYPQVVGGFTDVQVCNFDESGICPLSPTHQYLPANTTRGIEIGADKARITGCITVNAAG